MPQPVFLKFLIQHVLKISETDSAFAQLANNKRTTEQPSPTCLALSFLDIIQDGPKLQTDHSIRSLKMLQPKNGQRAVSFFFGNKVYTLSKGTTTQDQYCNLPALGLAAKYQYFQKSQPQKLQHLKEQYITQSRMDSKQEKASKERSTLGQVIRRKKGFLTQMSFVDNSKKFEDAISIGSEESSHLLKRGGSFDSKLKILSKEQLAEPYLSQLKETSRLYLRTSNQRKAPAKLTIGFRTLGGFNYNNVIHETDQESQQQKEDDATVSTQVQFQLTKDHLFRISKKANQPPLRTRTMPAIRVKQPKPDLSFFLQRDQNYLRSAVQDCLGKSSFSEMLTSRLPQAHRKPIKASFNLNQYLSSMEGKQKSQRTKRLDTRKVVVQQQSSQPQTVEEQLHLSRVQVLREEEQRAPLYIKKKVFADAVVEHCEEEETVRFSKKEQPKKKKNLYEKSKRKPRMVQGDKIWEEAEHHSSEDSDQANSKDRKDREKGKARHLQGFTQIQKQVIFSEVGIDQADEEADNPAQSPKRPKLGVKFSGEQRIQYQIQEGEADPVPRDTPTTIRRKNSRINSDMGMRVPAVSCSHVGVQSEKSYLSLESRSQRAQIINRLFYDDGRTDLPTDEMQEDFDCDFSQELLEDYAKLDAGRLAPAQELDHCLFDLSSPIDIASLIPNKLKNFKFLSALVILIQKSQQFVTRLFEKTDLDGGLQGIWLCVGGEWKLVLLDSRVVVNRKQKVIMPVCGSQLWPAFLEKAIRKVFGRSYSFDKLQLYQFLELLTGSPAVCFRLRENPKRNLLAFRYIEKTKGKNYTVTGLRYQQGLAKTWQSDNVWRVVDCRQEKCEDHLERKFKLQVRDQEYQVGQGEFCENLEYLVGLQLRLNSVMSSLQTHIATGHKTIIELSFQTQTRATLCIRTQGPLPTLSKTKKAIYKFEQSGLTALDISKEKQVPNIRSLLYHQIEQNCLRLVGQKKSNKEKSFFECNFKPGRYFLFIDCDLLDDEIVSMRKIEDEEGLSLCLSYFGQEKCRMGFLQRVQNKLLENESSEYRQAHRLESAHKQGLSARTSKFLESLEQRGKRIAKSTRNIVVRDFAELSSPDS